ncbi:hypothetical protein B0H14DRAFT_3171233 [Mycena olivaceomarginata]|nr:hypothetical protein B0H14DRAFT_3171233 [Mycena olivaceomarginata]
MAEVRTHPKSQEELFYVQCGLTRGGVSMVEACARPRAPGTDRIYHGYHQSRVLGYGRADERITPTPAALTATQELQAYVKEAKIAHLIKDSLARAPTVVLGLQVYFHRLLVNHLLYRFDYLQYTTIRSIYCDYVEEN